MLEILCKPNIINTNKYYLKNSIYTTFYSQLNTLKNIVFIIVNMIL